MKSKGKFIASIVAFVLAIGAAVGITYGITAAQNATVTSNINVGYKSHEVSAVATAQYKLGAGSDTAFTGGTSGAITFSGSEETATGSLGANVTLSKTNNVVIFKYSFENTGVGSEVDFTAVLTSEPTDTYENVLVSYSRNSGESWLVTGTASASDITSAKSFSVAQGATESLWIKVELVSVASDVAYAGNFAWTLTNNHLA